MIKNAMRDSKTFSLTRSMAVERLKMLRTVVVLIAVAIALTNASKNPNFAFDRSTIVHLFEWKWNDIADECERFLAPRGYGGVQVSPVVENVKLPNRPWYERYQPISYRWETRSGNEQEFRSMVRRCNNVGVRIYVDILLNHMSGNHENAVGTAGSKANTFDLHYPAVPYDRSHFHPVCEVNDYNSAVNVRNCELLGLHDLDQSQEYVRLQLLELMNGLIDAGVAGFRIDAAKHMWPEDLENIYSRLHYLNVGHGFAAFSKPFIYQEVVDYNSSEAVTKYQYNHLGAVTEFRNGWEISNAIRKRKPLKEFVSYGQGWGLLPSNDALIFIDNHDTQRNDGGDNPLTYKFGSEYEAAVAFMLAYPYGIPKVMSSFFFTDNGQSPPSDGNDKIISPSINSDNTCGNGWVCEHRWRPIYGMVGFKNQARNLPLTNWWDNGGYQISFCRGDRAFLAMNFEEYELKQRLKVCLPSGIYCDVATGELENGRCTAKTITVDDNGFADIVINPSDYYKFVAFHVGAKMA